jgi:predicted nucleotidyltransferase
VPSPVGIREQVLQSAAECLEARFRPAAILLYGSHAAGRDGSTSDVDLALVMGSTTIEPFALAAARTDLEEVLGRPVDLAVLDSASPILRMEVLRSGRILRKPDPERFETFVVRALGAYFDLKRVRAPIERALLAGGRT